MVLAIVKYLMGKVAQRSDFTHTHTVHYVTIKVNPAGPPTLKGMGVPQDPLPCGHQGPHLGMGEQRWLKALALELLRGSGLRILVRVQLGTP